MRKKFTNEEIGEAIGKMAEQIRSEMDFDFRVARGQMWLAENDLVYTLDEKQKVLYDEYCKKRDEFLAIVNEIFVRKY